VADLIQRRSFTFEPNTKGRSAMLQALWTVVPHRKNCVFSKGPTPEDYDEPAAPRTLTMLGRLGVSNARTAASPPSGITRWTQRVAPMTLGRCVQRGAASGGRANDQQSPDQPKHEPTLIATATGHDQRQRQDQCSRRA